MNMLWLSGLIVFANKAEWCVSGKSWSPHDRLSGYCTKASPRARAGDCPDHLMVFIQALMLWTRYCPSVSRHWDQPHGCPPEAAFHLWPRPYARRPQAPGYRKGSGRSSQREQDEAVSCLTMASPEALAKSVAWLHGLTLRCLLI